MEQKSFIRLILFGLLALVALAPSGWAYGAENTAASVKMSSKLKQHNLKLVQEAPDPKEYVAPYTVSGVRKLVFDTWTVKYHDGVPWDTTSNPRDLDLEVVRGAKILKFADGRYVQTIHRQYPASCGPSSLAMVLKQLGITNPVRSTESTSNFMLVQAPRKLFLPRDVDNQGGEITELGYRGSVEHLMWLGFHRRRLMLGMSEWNNDNEQFMSPSGLLNTTASTHSKSDHVLGREMDYLSFSQIPSWLWHAPAVGCGGSRNYYGGLPGIMNYIFSGGTKEPWRDARPLFFVGRHDDDVVIAARRIIKGFIDHDISIVGAVDSNGHFNAVIGYRGQVSPVSEPFYVYTADPLNGWGRPDNRQPGTWRRISISRDTLLDDSGEHYEGLFGGLIIWNHHAAGGAAVEFVRGDWATVVDAANGNEWLTGNGRKPHPIDPLDDSLSLSAQRTP